MSATKPASPPFLSREVVRRVARHPGESKNKICQRTPVLESLWRPSRNYHCCLELPFFGNGFRSKPRGKIRSWSPQGSLFVVLNLILATPATSQVPNCNGPTVPLDLSLTWRRGVRVGGMLHGQQPVPHMTLPRLTTIQFNHLHLLPHLGPYAPQGSTPLLSKLSVTSKVSAPTSHVWVGSLVHFRSSEDVTLLEFTSPIDRE